MLLAFKHDSRRTANVGEAQSGDSVNQARHRPAAAIVIRGAALHKVIVLNLKCRARRRAPDRTSQALPGDGK